MPGNFDTCRLIFLGGLLDEPKGGEFRFGVARKEMSRPWKLEKMPRINTYAVLPMNWRTSEDDVSTEWGTRLKLQVRQYRGHS